MKRIIALLLFVLSTTANAAVFVVGDVAAGYNITQCRVFEDGVDVGVVPVDINNMCWHAVTNISNGQHSVTMTAIVDDPIWGRQESAQSVPLSFVRPGQPSAPGGLRLSK